MYTKIIFTDLNQGLISTYLFQSESEEGLFFNTSMVKNKDAVMMVWDNALYNPDSDSNFSSHQDTADVQSLTNS